MKNYTHIFFDLDHTLWDYDKNVRESLSELFEIYTLEEFGILTGEHFYDAFIKVNYGLWGLYNKGEIDKINLRKERFKRIFEHLGADGLSVPIDMEEDFMNRTSSKKHLFPYSVEILAYLQKKYNLHIITNGFNESQALKMASSGLHPYFGLVITSETIGYKKPDKRIFEYAMSQLGTTADNCIMIGDSLQSDILGAQRVNMDQIFFNPENKPCVIMPDGVEVCPSYTIKCLSELKTIL
ncbi:YjjG family noncanonical pyrimidine nucleotidase [Anditalea andensis]|uniref:Haloacid dehalogenase n=1 Tax=Anditalea andensis TaxID=1048983 RepID=A0A074KZU1_9BACT|nr:YjjG family noncanonical pyrimidine nucleotidase [Anditalea andensis]KEO73098.1 haloacid dehalogenase [Anditalea andensis]